MVPALFIANYIIEYSNEKGYSINNLKLQKLLYFVNVSNLVTNKEPLFEEKMKKWKYGPVIPSVYHEFKKYGAFQISIKDIVEDYLHFKFEGDISPETFEILHYTKDQIDDSAIKLINNIVDYFSQKDAFELVDITHKQELWKKDEKQIMDGEQGIEYTEAEIISYFENHPWELPEGTEHMTKGKLIAIEGIDGAGKSTIIKKLVELLNSHGYKAICHQEPGTTDMGLALRKLIKSDIPRSKLTEILMFEAGRADTSELVLSHELEQYDYVIMDRYIDSTVAYQGYGNQNPIEIISTLNDIAIGENKPDMRILIDVDMETAYKRRNKRKQTTDSKDKFDTNYEFAKRVYDGYQSLVEKDELISVPNTNMNETLQQLLHLICDKEIE
jgi:dTMP kinase